MVSIVVYRSICVCLSRAKETSKYDGRAETVYQAREPRAGPDGRIGAV